MTVCHYHGARNPGAIRKANERIAQAEAAKHLEFLGEVAPVTDPVGRLQLVVGEAEALLRYCRGRFAVTESPEWLTTYGRALESIVKQLETLAKLLPPVQAAKAEADEAEARETLKQVVAVLNGALDEPGVGLLQRQKERIRHAIAAALPGEPVAPLPDVPPGHGASGRLPGFTVTLDLLNRMTRTSPRWMTDDMKADVEALRVAAAAFLDTHGHPAEVTGEAALTGVQAALPPAIDDAEVVG
jgi:hypothetical protein